MTIWVVEECYLVDPEEDRCGAQFFCTDLVQWATGLAQGGGLPVGEAQDMRRRSPVAQRTENGAETERLIVGMGANGQHPTDLR
jgi:hypothetical protein